MGTEPRTVDQLRHEIDAGQAGDKVAVRDPAAVPLGADDEAAGTANSQTRIRLAAALELRRPPLPAGPRAERRHFPVSWLWIALVGLLTGAAVVVALLSRAPV